MTTKRGYGPALFLFLPIATKYPLICMYHGVR